MEWINQPFSVRRRCYIVNIVLYWRPVSALFITQKRAYEHTHQVIFRFRAWPLEIICVDFWLRLTAAPFRLGWMTNGNTEFQLELACQKKVKRNNYRDVQFLRHDIYLCGCLLVESATVVIRKNFRWDKPKRTVLPADREKLSPWFVWFHVIFSIRRSYCHCCCCTCDEYIHSSLVRNKWIVPKLNAKEFRRISTAQSSENEMECLDEIRYNEI